MPSDPFKKITLDRFLVQRQHTRPEASGELTRVLVQLGTVAKIIASFIGRSSLEGLKGATGETNVQGEKVKKMDSLGNDAFVDAFEYVDIVGAIVSEEMDNPKILHSDKDREKYVVLIDPIDGSSNLAADCPIGSIFSVRRLADSVDTTILQAGTQQVAAGYILYSTAVLMLYSAGDGVHSFVLDEEIGEFILDHESIRIPERGRIISANFANRAHWRHAPHAFTEALFSDPDHDYSLRYSGALVADLHQILHYGGLYFYPEDDQRPQGKLRLLYECAPLAMIAEQAGGGATTGTERIMDIAPENIHQRVPFAIGGSYEIERYRDAYSD